MREKSFISGVKRFLRILGPGLITGASDDDPAAIGTYAKAGASLGYMLLWAPLLLFPLMLGVQFISAKVGLVTGCGLAGVLKRYYPKRLLYIAVFSLIIANTIEAGADLGAMAAAVNLIVPAPVHLLILAIAGAILIVQALGRYSQIKKLFKWLTLGLFAYIGAGFLARPDPTEVLTSTLVPHIRVDAGYLSMLVAVIGASISPYLFFWLTYGEVEERHEKGKGERKRADDRELKRAGLDVGAGMLFANIVVYFVMLATAATLNKSGVTDINSAVEAAAALRPLAGDAAEVLWAVGLLGVGFLGVPVLTGSVAYAFSEALSLPGGLDKRPGKARGFYAVIGASTATAVMLNFTGINPIKALFIVEIINGFVAPPLLLLIMLIANNREIMGDKVNGPVSNFIGWTTAVATFFAAAGLVLTWAFR